MIFKKLLPLLLFTIVLLTFAACSDEPIGEGDTAAYIIKIDGKDVGYAKNKDDVDAIVSELKSAKEKELTESNFEVIRVSINSKIESVSALCNADDLQSPEQIVEKYINSGGKISFSVTVSEKETKYLSFETVYKNSSSHYEGTKVVQTTGQNGERELIHEVTYTDGKEIERKLVSEKDVKQVVNEVVLVGTKKSTASTGKYAWPLKSVTVTSSYGNRYLNGSYNFHLGVDLRASNGTSVYAADGGKITHAGWLSSYGYLIIIVHDNGDYTYYAHLSKISVSVGSRVYKGQEIAKSGSTGNVTGPHLHFEIRKNGSTVNPVSYLPSAKGVNFARTVSLDSCSLQAGTCLSRFGQSASLSSKREQEECL